jgi:hypothetical protein
MTVRADEVAPRLFRVENVAPSGWSWNMLLVRLADGDLLVHSPTWAGEGTFEAVEALGRPSVLFAPNHFHHLPCDAFASAIRARAPSPARRRSRAFASRATRD